MPKRHRIHVPGGTYYIFRRTDPRHPIFSGPTDYPWFEDFLKDALESSGAKLLAYCWLPEALHLVIEVGKRPVAEFMRDLTWRYSRAQGQRGNEERPWFREPYHATLLRSETYLVALICHVHYLPVRAGLAQHPDDYPYTSHHAYPGRRSKLRLYCGRMLALLGCHDGDRTAYHAAMSDPPAESFADIFERGLPDTPGVVGDQELMPERKTAPVSHHCRDSSLFLDRLIRQIAECHEISLDELRSKSRRRDLVIARAQITWFAILWNLSSVNELASRLRHSPSALSRAATRHRRLRPELFTPEAVTRTRVRPIVQARPASA